MVRCFFILLFIPFLVLHASNLSILDEKPPVGKYTEPIDIDAKFTVVHRNFNIIDEFKFGYSLGLGEFVSTAELN